MKPRPRTRSAVATRHLRKRSGHRDERNNLVWIWLWPLYPLKRTVGTEEKKPNPCLEKAISFVIRSRWWAARKPFKHRFQIFAGYRTQLAIHEPLPIPNTTMTVQPCAAPCVRNKLKAKTNLKCNDFGAVAFSKRFCAHPSALKIRLSAPAFTTNVRERGEDLTSVDRCKVRLVVQGHRDGQHTGVTKH